MYVDKFTEIRRTMKEGPCLGRRNYMEEWANMWYLHKLYTDFSHKDLGIAVRGVKGSLHQQAFLWTIGKYLTGCIIIPEDGNLRVSLYWLRMHLFFQHQTPFKTIFMT
jgi:hypothetical protein